MLTSRWAAPSSSYSNGNCVEARWRKSSHSAGSNCAEARWRKSSHSASGSCAEARTADGHVQVRDSKLGEASPVLSFTPAAWQAFLTQVKT